jgi:hypothetical protein
MAGSEGACTIALAIDRLDGITVLKEGPTQRFGGECPELTPATGIPIPR